MAHHEAEIPRDPESERRGHELRDVAAKPIVLFLVGLFVFGGAVEYGMRVLMQGYVAHDSKIAVPTSDEILHDQGIVTGPPPPQKDTTADMLRMYAEENKVLTSFGLDPKTKRYHIPIDRAMKVVAKKGLPHKDTPASEIERDLPYPKHSQPYMATAD